MSGLRNGLKGASLAALAGSLLVATPTVAQTVGQPQTAAPATPATAPPSTPAAQTDGASQPQDTSGDIVVTARKREERLRDVPLAVTALGQQYLVEKNVTQISGLSTVVPNITFSQGINQPQLFIRGFGSGTNAGFDQSVAKFYDNVYLGRDQDGRLPIFDVERLEVLKGPQVITFGNSATAGALNIITKTAGSSFSADAVATYEFYDQETKLQGGVTVPVSDNASFRLAGFFQTLDKGEAYNALLGRHEPLIRNWAVRPTFAWTPIEGLRVKIVGEYDRVKSLGTAIQAVRQPLRPGAPLYPEVNDRNLNNNDYSTAPNFSNNEAILHHGIGLLDVSYDALGGTFVSTTAYRQEKNEVNIGNPGGTNYAQVSFLHSLQRYKQISQELRFNGTYGAIDLSVGGYYEHNVLHIDQVNTFSFAGFGLTGLVATPLTRVVFYDQDFDKYSGVVDGTYRLGAGFSVSAGVRYSRYAKDASQFLFGAPIIPRLNFGTTRDDLLSFRSPTIEATALTAVSGGVPHSYPNLSRTENHWQPQVIGQWKYGDSMVYAKYATGVKSGGFDFNYASANPSGIAFGPEKAQIFEFGVKGLTLGGKLDYAIALFRQKFTDLQFSVFQGTGFFVTNVGEARTEGLEVEANYRPIRGLRLSVNAAYIDPRYIDYRNAACNTNLVLVTPAGCRQDLSGARLQYTSRLSGNIGVDYEMPVADYRVTGGASVFARSNFNTSATNDPFGWQDGFAQIDAHLDVRPNVGPWTATLFARNLNNIRYLNYVAAPPGNNTSLISGYERGRQIGLQFSVRY